MPDPSNGPAERDDRNQPPTEVGGWLADDALGAELVAPTEQQRRVPCSICGRPCLPPALADLAPVCPACAPTACPPPVPSQPVHLGKYEIVRELGSGGMGVVYLARDLLLDRIVAVKTLHPHIARNPEAAERFLREARIAATLEHPGVVPIFDVGSEDGTPYYAMAYIPGRTLGDVVAERKTALRERVRLVREAAAAMAYAHGRGVIHRDLKPENILLDAADRAHVLDFGLARCLAGSDRLTQSGQMLGTPSYMAPEQMRGRNDEVGLEADVYSLGAVLYHAITGRPPYHADTITRVIAGALSEDLQPPSSVVRGLPRDLEAICLKALEREPSRRYPSAREFADDLTRHLDGEPVTARLDPVWRPTVRWIARRKVLSAALGALLLALVTIGLLHGSRRDLQEQIRAGLRTRAAAQVRSALQMRRRGVALAPAANELLEPLQETARAAEQEDPGRPEPHFYLGRLCRALMRWNEAIEHQQQALQLNPGFAPSRYELAVLQARAVRDRLLDLRERPAKTGGAAAGAVDHARSRPPLDPVLRGLKEGVRASLETLLALLDGRPEWSTMSEPLLRVDRSKIACLHGLLAAYGGSGWLEAEAALRQAIDGDPSLEEAHEALAYAAYEDHRWKDAIAACDAGLEQDAGFVPHRATRGSARLLLARAVWQSGVDADRLLDAAAEDLAQAREMGGAAPDLARSMGLMHLIRGIVDAERGRDPAEVYARAVAAYEESIRLDAGRAAAWVGAGTARMNAALAAGRRGRQVHADFERARADVDRALALEPDDPDSLLLSGHLHLNLGLDRFRREEDGTDSFRAAVRDLTRAAEFAPGLGEAWSGCAGARVAWAKSIVRQGEDPGDLPDLALQDLGRAEAAGERKPVLQEWTARARECRMRQRARRGEHPEDDYAMALASLEVLERIAPKDPAAWHLRGEIRDGWALHLAERGGGDPVAVWAEAERDQTEAIRLQPTWADAWRLRGNVRARRGTWLMLRGSSPDADFGAARSDYDEAIRLAPEDPTAWSDRGALSSDWGYGLQRRGEDPAALHAGALADLDRAIALAPGLLTAWNTRASTHVKRGMYLAQRSDDPSGEFAAAVRNADEVIGRSVSRATPWHFRGIAQREWGCYLDRIGEDPSGHLAEAVRSFDEALELDPRKSDSRVARAIAALLRGDLSERRSEDASDAYRAAASDYDRLLTAQGNNAAFLLGRLRASLGLARDAHLHGQDPRTALDLFHADLERLNLAALGGSSERIRQVAGDLVRELSSDASPGGSVRVELKYVELLAEFGFALQARRLGERLLVALEPTSAEADAERRAAAGYACFVQARILTLNLLGFEHPLQPARKVPETEARELRRNALDHLRRAVDLGWDDRARLDSDPALAPLRSDPGWSEAVLPR